MADPSGVFFDGDGGLPRVGEGGDGGEAGEKLVLGEEALEGFDLSPIGFGGEDGKGGAGRRKDGGSGVGCLGGGLSGRENDEDTDGDDGEDEKEWKCATHGDLGGL